MRSAVDMYVFPTVHVVRLRTHLRKAAAFTLIELLVVIAIIVLLIGILLPALGAARETARTVVCSTTLRQYGVGMTQYALDYKEWIVGPSSSGAIYQLMVDDNVNPVWGDGSAEAPTTCNDWMTPCLSTPLSKNRARRMKQVFEQFGCSATKVKYQTYYGSAPDYQDFEALLYGEGIKQNSYVSPYGLQYYPSDDAANRNKITVGALTRAPLSVPSGHYSTVRPNPGYTPKVHLIGTQASKKVFAMDGTRYIDRTANTFDFDINMRDFLGTPIESSPIYEGATAFGRNSGIANQTVVPDNWKLSLRHPGNGANAVFFDGSVKNMRPKELYSEVSYYWPGGSVFGGTSCSLESLQKYRPGDKLP